MIEIDLDLTNAGFEDGWREVNGAHELKVAEGWHPWWHGTDTRPEFKIAPQQVDDYRVRSGNAAQQWFTSYATHTGGIYQQVHGIPIGKQLVFAAFVQGFSRDDDADWRRSNGRYRMRIGIDPYGGIDPEGGDIVWGEAIQPYDDWFALRIETVSRSDRCTVFVWGQAEWRVKHNNGYVDDCRLFYLDEEPPPPPPPPPPPTTDEVKQVAQAVADFARTVSQAADELATKMDELST